MKERDMQAAIIQAARLRLWHVYFTWRSDHSPAGFPDLICIRDGRLVVLELKTKQGRVSNFQRWWLEAFREIPCAEVYVVRESNPKPGELSYDQCLELFAASSYVAQEASTA